MTLTSHVLSYLCRTTLSLGEYAEAEKLLRESLVLAREIDYHYGVGLALNHQGFNSLALGDAAGSSYGYIRG